MNKLKIREFFKNLLVMALVFALAVALCLLLAKTSNDNNPFAVPVFILAVALIARMTAGYVWGIAASCAGVLCVNVMFTYPFWKFDITIAGYPLTFAAMLFVSIIISALTTQIKKQERLRYDMEAEKMRANLLRSVSHDLRTPLSAISGASSALLENDALPEADRVELLREINKDARWLIRVTENILSLTKFTGSGVQLRTESEVLEDIVGSAIVKFRKNYPDFTVSVSRPEQILLVPMDAVLIEQVLVNLFENAVMHGKTADRLLVRITCQPKRAVISVEDNGVGFSDSVLPHAFDGYAGETARPTDNRRNMGIGLSVCRSIILAHGGDISARNLKQGGGAVEFWLPCEEDVNVD